MLLLIGFIDGQENVGRSRKIFMKKLIICVFFLFLISTSVFAETVKWTNCKVVENAILDSYVRFLEDEEFFKKKSKEEQDKFIKEALQGKTVLHEIIFDLEKNLVSENKQKKGEEVKKTEQKFNIVSDTIIKVVGKEKVMEFSDKKIRAINIITYDFSDATKTNHLYHGNLKELIIKIRCKIGSPNKLEYWWVVVLIMLISFFAYTQIAKTTGRKRKK